MRIIILSILLGLLIQTCGAQNLMKYDSVYVIENQNHLNKVSNHKFMIYRMDSLDFLKKIRQSKRVVVEFWQPWCGGSDYTIPYVNQRKKILDSIGVEFLLISDSRFDSIYFKNQSTSIGRIVYFFNKYDIRFPTYIISSNTTLDDYRKLIYRYTKHRPIKRDGCFYIESGKLVSYDYAYRFYKRLPKKLNLLNQ